MIQLLKDQVIANRYRLERPMGQGGMGLVWVARHVMLDAEVAVKFMAPAFVELPEMRARFEREARAAALLKSPHVVQVHDYGVEDDTPYIVMERLEGEDLQARLKRERRLTCAATGKIVAQLCKALRRAHEVGLVHRDLKPANVFMAENGDDDVVKILDFGIVKSTGKALPGLRTNGHMIVGSPQYMAPEQILDQGAVDHRADLWSLGVIAFRCLVGRNPFASKGPADLILEICSGNVPLASKIAPDLDRDVDAFFQRALARDRAQRFQSADEFREAFSKLALSTGEERAPALTNEWNASISDEADTVVVPESGKAAGISIPSAPIPTTPTQWTVQPIPTFSVGRPWSKIEAPARSGAEYPTICSDLPAPRRGRWAVALAAGVAIAIAAAASIVSVRPAPAAPASPIEPPSPSVKASATASARASAAAGASAAPSAEQAPAPASAGVPLSPSARVPQQASFGPWKKGTNKAPSADAADAGADDDPYAE